jgi:hypothetical protein
MASASAVQPRIAFMKKLFLVVQGSWTQGFRNTSGSLAMLAAMRRANQEKASAGRLLIPEDIIKQVEVLWAYNAPGNMELSRSIQKSWRR